MVMPRASMLLQLFWTFCRIGPATFGGGYAMIPLIERETVEKRRWLEEQEMSDLLSVAGSAPGGVGVNASAFIGYRLAGVPGAIAAILGITLPTFLVVLALSLAYMYAGDSPKVQAAMQGIHGAILALILVSAIKMARSSLFDAATVAIFACTLALLLTTGVNPVFVVAAGIGGGVVCVASKSLLGMRIRTEKDRLSREQGEIVYPEYYI